MFRQRRCKPPTIRPQAGSTGYELARQPGEIHSEGAEPEVLNASHPSHKGADGIHEASEHSIWPFVLACGLLLIGIGMMGQLLIAAAGATVVLLATIGWMWQPWTS